MNNEKQQDSNKTSSTLKANFLLQLISNGLTKFADALVDVKTVLPWIMNALNVPVWLISLLVPLRESGSLLPQFWVTPWIKRFNYRKWVWVIGSVGQALSVGIIVFFALSFHGSKAGFGIVAALVLFSLFRSLCSITSKDIMGRTIPKTRRGQLGGWSSSIAGIVTLCVGVLLIVNEQAQEHALYLLGIAVFVWLLAALFYMAIKEKADNEDNKDAAENAGVSLSLLIKDNDFRQFVLIRTLLLSTALSAPFYTLLIQQYYPENKQLGFLLIASSIAGIVSGPLWGKMADWSSRRVLIWSALMSGLLGFVIVVYTLLTDSVLLVVLLGAFFIALLAHQGVRLGRKTYVVDMATGDKRTDYVAIGNTFIGVMLLVCAAIGLLVDSTSAISAIAFFAMLSLIASLLASKLPEVEALAEENTEYSENKE